VEIASDGVGRFACAGQSVSVYVNEKAAGRDLFATYIKSHEIFAHELGYHGLRSLFNVTE